MCATVSHLNPASNKSNMKKAEYVHIVYISTICPRIILWVIILVNANYLSQLNGYIWSRIHNIVGGESV